MAETRQEVLGRSAMYPPFARPSSSKTAPQGERDAMLPDIAEFLDELPAIEEFLPAPAADDSRPGSPASVSAGERNAPTPLYRAPSPDIDDDGWVVGAWQRYDWEGTTSLAARASDDSAADADWSTTDWGSRKATPPGKPAPRNVGSSAREIADALDSIASKIRNGELPVDNFRATPPEAAMAAALAALLKLRG